MPIAQSRLETLQVCKLLQCVRDGNTDQIEKMTLHGIPHLINYNDPVAGETALSVAACANNEIMVEFLLGLGAHPDVMDFQGRTAAMRGAEYGHVQCLEKLARANGNFHLTDLDGKGILFYCISPTERHEKCFEIAVTHGAEVNNKAKDGTHVFLMACETALENEKMCVLLLKKGADPNAKNEKSGRTALMAASQSGSAAVVRAILDKGGDVNMMDSRSNHACHYAGQGGFFDVLRCLSAFSANFNQTNSDGNTPIHLAAKAGHAMCCKFLAQRGCNPKPKNNEGEIARSMAKDYGNHKEAIKELRKVEKSFGKVAKNAEPWVILLYDWAVEREQQLTKMFRKYDPDENGTIPASDFSDCLTALKVPIEEDEMTQIVSVHDKRKEGMVDFGDFLCGKKYVNKNFLLSAFEGKKKKKKKGKKGGKKGKFKLVMPICMMPDGSRTIAGGPPEMFIERQIHFTDTKRFDRDHPPVHPLQDDSAWYIHHPEKSYLNVNEAARIGDLDSLKSAMQRNIPVDTRDKYFKTPLMAASASGNLEVVWLLLDCGAAVNARDNFKWTPLHHACHAGQLEIVQQLMNHGAELDSSALSGATPLMRAIESSKVDVVEYLISKGAKIQTENKKGHTPVDIAVAWADTRVLDAIQAKWDSMPALSDKKKGGGAAGKKSAAGGGKGKKSPSDREVVSPKPPHSLARMDTDMPPLQRKGSILRAASALAGGLDDKEDITYIPLKPWTTEPTTDELVLAKQMRRARFGWQVDFEDFKMPFQSNIARRVEILGDDDDD